MMGGNNMESNITEIKSSEEIILGPRKVMKAAHSLCIVIPATATKIYDIKHGDVVLAKIIKTGFVIKSNKKEPKLENGTTI